MLHSLRSFAPRGLQIRRVLPAPGHVTIEVDLCRDAPTACPACGFASDRVHSGYKRVLHDLPWQGRSVIVEVAARRLRCLNIACLLPDRQAETLATWLRRHPGIEIVVRDRAGAYAEGVRQGAPGAVQVADRWHILCSLSDAVRSVVDRHHAEIRRVVTQWAEPVVTTASLAAVGTTPSSVPATRAERRHQDAYARRQARYEEAARLRMAGVSIKRIAALLGVERKTVRGWLRAGSAPTWRAPPRTGVLGPHLDYLERRWIEGCRNATQLWRELAAFGFTGRPGCVKQWAGRRRKDEPVRTSNGADVTRRKQPPSTQQLTRMLMAEPGSFPEAAGTLVSRLLEHIPGLEGVMYFPREGS